MPGQVEEAVTSTLQDIYAVGDNTRRFSQAQSAEFYEILADELVTRANTIRDEMEDDADGI